MLNAQQMRNLTAAHAARLDALTRADRQDFDRAHAEIARLEALAYRWAEEHGQYRAVRQQLTNAANAAL